MTDTTISDDERSAVQHWLSMAPTVEARCDELDRIEARINEINAGAESIDDDEMEWVLECVNGAWRDLADTPCESTKDLVLKAARLKVLKDDAADDDNGYVAEGMVPLLEASLAADATKLAAAA